MSRRRYGMSTMDVELGVEHNEAVLRFAGELDMGVADDMRAMAAVTLERGGLTTLIIDLSEVTFIDSTGLSALVKAKELATEKDVAMVICGVSANAEKVFTLTGLSEYFGLPPGDLGRC
jgi:anti-anti-sigma factor